jgi:hypothetical protein
MTQGLTKAKLIINNERVGYISNSLKDTSGFGERTVSPQNLGGGETSNVITEDVSTFKGKIMFDLKTTQDNKALLREWQSNLDANTVKIEYPSGKISLYENATVINDPERDDGVDGVMSVEMEAKPEIADY